MSTNWSNTWEHACYCAFMFTFTEKHVCFHVISLFSAHALLTPLENGPLGCVVGSCGPGYLNAPVATLVLVQVASKCTNQMIYTVYRIGYRNYLYILATR